MIGQRFPSGFLGVKLFVRSSDMCKCTIHHILKVCDWLPSPDVCTASYYQQGFGLVFKEYVTALARNLGLGFGNWRVGHDEV